MELVRLDELELTNTLTKVDPMEFEAYCADLTIAVNYAKPTLAQLYKQAKKSQVMKLIMTAVLKKIKTFGEKADMSGEELRALVLDYCSLRQSESIEDLLLCLDYGRQGRYGKVYGKVDVMTINEWLGKYFDEKYAYVETLHKQKKKQLAISAELTASLRKEIERVRKYRVTKFYGNITEGTVGTFVKQKKDQHDNLYYLLHFGVNQTGQKLQLHVPIDILEEVKE